jgi:hypothetical protein
MQCRNIRVGTQNLVYLHIFFVSFKKEHDFYLLNRTSYSFYLMRPGCQRENFFSEPVLAKHIRIILILETQCKNYKLLTT